MDVAWIGVRSWLLLLLAGGPPWGPAFAFAKGAEFGFEQYQIETGSARSQVVLTGSFLPGQGREIAVVSLEPNGERRLRLYAFGSGGWEREVDTELDPGVRFVDVARIGTADRLLTYRPGRLHWFDPESATERPLVTVGPEFYPPPGGEIRRIRVACDLNGDGLDDLLVPDSEGVQVYLQESGGTFAEPVKLGPAAPFLEKLAFKDTRSYGELGWTARTHPWHRQRVHRMDYDRDGRLDLVFWNRNRFELYPQQASGRFQQPPLTFTSGVGFGSAGLHSLIFRDRKRWRVLRSLNDLNGDGVADLLTFSLAGKKLLKELSAYEVHFGAPSDGGTVFAPEPDTSVQSDGIQLGMRLHDFDGDGRQDMMFIRADLGVRKIFRGLLTQAMSFDLEFYRMEGGRYPAQPTAVRKIRWKSRAFPAVLTGDVNGDGRSDLLLQKGRKRLRVFLGVPGPELFALEPLDVKVALPKATRNEDRQLRIYAFGNGPWESILDEEYTWLVDLDRDGRQDVLLHQPSRKGPHRVTILMAR